MRRLSHRVRALWIPGVLVAALSVCLYWVIDRVPPLGSARSFWLAGLAGLGALGAYVSRRAGGSVRDSVLVSLFPAFWQALTFARDFVAFLPFGRSLLSATSILINLLDRVLIPALGLLGGAALLLRTRAGKPA